MLPTCQTAGTTSIEPSECTVLAYTTLVLVVDSDQSRSIWQHHLVGNCQSLTSPASRSFVQFWGQTEGLRRSNRLNRQAVLGLRSRPLCTHPDMATIKGFHTMLYTELQLLQQCGAHLSGILIYLKPRCVEAAVHVIDRFLGGAWLSGPSSAQIQLPAQRSLPGRCTTWRSRVQHLFISRRALGTHILSKFACALDT